MYASIRRVGGLLGAVAVTACSDSTSAGRTASLSFSGVRPPGVAPAGGAGLLAGSLATGDSMVITVGANTLIINSVEVLLREVELKRAGASDCDSTTASDDCEKFEVGAMLMTVPLAAGTEAGVTINVDSGLYTEIEFDIHKLGTDAEDNAFLAAHPGWPANTSIRVTGRYNGTPFTFITDLDEEQEIAFNPPLDLTAGSAAVNVTLRMDVSVWFRNGATGPLIDPNTANQGGANKSLVDNNIKNSIKAFEDDDHDGDERDG